MNKSNSPQKSTNFQPVHTKPRRRHTKLYIAFFILLLLIIFYSQLGKLSILFKEARMESPYLKISSQQIVMGPPGMFPTSWIEDILPEVIQNRIHDSEPEVNYVNLLSENQVIPLDPYGDENIKVVEFNGNSALIEFKHLYSDPPCDTQQMYVETCIVTLERNEPKRLRTMTVDGFTSFDITYK